MKTLESSQMFIKEKVLPIALSVVSVCSTGAKPFERMPFTPPRQEQSALIYAGTSPEKNEIQQHPLGILLEKSTAEDLQRVGLKVRDKPEVMAGLITHGEKRNYSTRKTEIVFHTNTSILDSGFRVWSRSFLQPHSIFSSQDVQTCIARLLLELSQRFGLPAIAVSSKKNANCDIHITDFTANEEWDIGKGRAGLHPFSPTKRYESPFGIFENIVEPYAWSIIHDYRDAGEKYKNIPVEVIKEFGIDCAVKAMIHELTTHKILGQNHSTTPGDISRAELTPKLRDARHPEAHRKPWSHIYTSKNGNEYIANFCDGDPLNDQTNKVVRFLRLVRMKEKQ